MTWNKKKAKKEIQRYFKRHKASTKKATASATDGKVYELFCLVKTIKWLKRRYSISVKFIGETIDFKASPGNVDRSRSYFEISGNGSKLELHTDIQIQTLGASNLRASKLPGAVDNSGFHEIDIVLIDSAVDDRKMPRHDQLFLGVECKAYANFNKGIVKQVLGVRRELSFYRPLLPYMLDCKFGYKSNESVNARPPSLFWLAFTDSKGKNYSKSPGFFGIEFKHWTT